MTDEEDYLTAFRTKEPSVIDRLSRSNDYRTRLAIAASPSITEVASANLLRDRWEDVALTVIRNPCASWQALDAYLREVIAAVDPASPPPDDSLATSGSFRTRLSVALSPSIGEEACATLLRDTVGLVASATVLNPSCSPRALRDFLKDPAADQYPVRGYLMMTDGKTLYGAVALEEESQGLEPRDESFLDGIPLEWILLTCFPE